MARDITLFIHHPRGRGAMIVDFMPRGTHRGPWFPGRTDIVSSIALQPNERRPGRVYFAVPRDIRARTVMDLRAPSKDALTLGAQAPRVACSPLTRSS